MRHVKNIVSYFAFVALVASCTTEPLMAGSGSGWAGFAGGMMGGTMLGAAMASNNRPREVVYVQEPAPRRNYNAEEDAYQAGLEAGRRQALAERKQKQAKGKKKTAAPAVVEANEEEMDLNEEA